jgi:cobalt-zinc-cadmium efflux system protein
MPQGHDHPAHGPEADDAHSERGHDHAAHDHSGRSHGHSHGHSHGIPKPGQANRAFFISVVLNVAFVVVEVAYGLGAQSLALLADAGHNLSDVLGLLLAWGASLLCERRPTARRTFGWRRSSILAALSNALVLLLTCGGIAWEAIQRLQNPTPVATNTVMAVAAIGIVINTISALVLMRSAGASEHGSEDLNLRGAILHMASDAAVSLGVVLAGLAIVLTGWNWLDPLVSLGITAIIVLGTWNLLRESVNLAMDGVPIGIEPAAVRAYLAALPGVQEAHDLHIWAMSTTETAMTVHLVMPTGHPGDGFIRQVDGDLRHRFGIAHPTLQIELGNGETHCRLAPDHVV